MVFYKITQGVSKGGLCYGRQRIQATARNSIGCHVLTPIFGLRAALIGQLLAKI
jgi:hypothetical protein